MRRNSPEAGGPVPGDHGLGMELGLWIEPEMVSEESCLYRAHPDWVLNPPGRPYTRGRCQLVLDFTRDEVPGGGVPRRSRPCWTQPTWLT